MPNQQCAGQQAGLGAAETEWTGRLTANPYSPPCHHWYTYRFLCHAALSFARNLDRFAAVTDRSLMPLVEESIRYNATVLVGIEQHLILLKSVMELDPTINARKRTKKAIEAARYALRPATDTR